MPQLLQLSRSADRPSLEYTLVVVHMQPWIVSPHDAIVEEVETVIKRAVADNVGIILLEWEGKDPTLTSIRQLLEEYPHWTTAYKAATNGANVVMDACTDKGFWLNHLVICGVALHVCVAATIRGLTEAMPLGKVELIKSATDKPDKSFDWSTYPNQDKQPSPANLILSDSLHR
jgi:nicotinamidase-related amidase